MSKGTHAPISDLLEPGSYSFVVLDLRRGEKGELEARARRALEGLLPRAPESDRLFCQRVGRRGGLIVTLVKGPLPPSFDPAKASLPFALELADKAPLEIEWACKGVAQLARYEEGRIRSVLAIRNTPSTELPPPSEAQGPALHREQRAAIANGKAVQLKTGPSAIFWKLVDLCLVCALAAQVCALLWAGIGVKAELLSGLENQIALIEGLGRSSVSPKASSPDSGLQTLADRVQGSIALRWMEGYFLQRWSLKGRELRLEGWGPRSLDLLGSLKAAPALAKLAPLSISRQGARESFVFSGEVGYD